jgi:hypothetical protein
MYFLNKIKPIIKCYLHCLVHLDPKYMLDIVIILRLSSSVNFYISIIFSQLGQLKSNLVQNAFKWKSV